MRVRIFDQNENRQLDGLEVDWVFPVKALNKNLNRGQLELMLRLVRAGDPIVFHSMDRLGRNLDDLRLLVLGLTV
jgi:DNA invertase Pin-like site-specific DNA recombinase